MIGWTIFILDKNINAGCPQKSKKSSTYDSINLLFFEEQIL